MHTSNLGGPRSVCLNPLLIGEHFPTGAYGFQTLEWIYVSIPFSSGNTFQLGHDLACPSGAAASQSPSHRGTLSNNAGTWRPSPGAVRLNPLLIGEHFLRKHSAISTQHSDSALSSEQTSFRFLDFPIPRFLSPSHRGTLSNVAELSGSGQ